MLALLLALAAAPQVQQAQAMLRYPRFDKLYCATVDAGYCDEYYIDGPTLQPGKKYPLVILFHGYQERADEAKSRCNMQGVCQGWYPGAQNFIDAATSWSGVNTPSEYIVVMHDGGFTNYVHPTNGPTDTFNTYGTEEFMRATEAVLTDVVNKWPIDRKRMYGYGLSMGGGECLAYAARHQDPTSKTMLSAVVNHSGTISMTRIYETAQPIGQQAWDTYYDGGSYGSSPQADYHFQRATAMDLPFNGMAATPLDYELKFGLHQGHNLRWLPRANFHVGQSPPDHQEHMIDPTDAFQNFLAEPTLVNAPDQVSMFTPAAIVHNWSAIAPGDILTYFDGRKKLDALNHFSTQFSAPNGVEVLLFAEDDTRHHSYSVTRNDTDLFGRLCVNVSNLYWPGTNSIIFIYGQTVPSTGAVVATDNIDELTIHVDNHLKYVDWSAGDTVGVVARDLDMGTIHAEGAPVPTSVEQLGSMGFEPAFSPADWFHDGTTLHLYVDPTDTLQRQWRIHN